MLKQFSKRILVVDYIITAILIISLFVFLILNNKYELNIDFSVFGIVIGAWIAQLGVSSSCYYILIKSEHKVELPMRLLEELPDDVKDKIDLTTIITTVLTSSDN